MKKQYYKIGDFSRLSGVSIRSLRYYDRIGALKPAYVNEETGYRYYMPEQMIQLEVVKLSLAMKLPLKDLVNDANGQIPNLKKLIEDGQRQAKKQLLETQKMLRLSDNLLEQINRLDVSHPEEIFYRCQFDKRYVLVCPWDTQKDDGQSYVDKIEILHKMAEQQGAIVLTQQGLLFDCEKEKVYVFLTIEGAKNIENCMCFPAATYDCMILEEHKMNDLPQMVAQHNQSIRYIFCLNTDIFTFCLENNFHRLEAQCLLP